MKVTCLAYKCNNSLTLMNFKLSIIPVATRSSKLYSVHEA
jgi:hypothetical protein